MQNVNEPVSIWKKELSLTINNITKVLLTPSPPMLSESLGSSSFKDYKGERTLSAFVTCSNYQHGWLSDYHNGDSYPERGKSAVRTVMKDFYCWCSSLYFPNMSVTFKFLSTKGWRQFCNNSRHKENTLKSMNCLLKKKKFEIEFKFHLKKIQLAVQTKCTKLSSMKGNLAFFF